MRETKKNDIFVEKLKSLKDAQSFDSLILLLDILQHLASSEEVEELNTQDTSIKLFFNDKIRVGTIYNYIHENFINFRY